MKISALWSLLLHGKPVYVTFAVHHQLSYHVYTLKVHYNSLPLGAILSQKNPAHILTHNFLNKHFNIIPTLTRWSPYIVSFLHVFRLNYVGTSRLSDMAHPPNPHGFDELNNINKQFSSATCYCSSVERLPGLSSAANHSEQFHYRPYFLNLLRWSV